MIPPPIAGIDHIAVLVEDIEAALPYYTETLGFTVIADDRVEAVQARLVMLQLGDGRLQLVTPIADGPIAEYLRVHGEGLHHLALKTGQIDTVVNQLSPDAPVRVVRGGQQRLGGFLPYRPNNVMLEVIEIDE
ncbi:MAG TPA: VOC family protein [Thermomicrobiales bacterium]|jgi:methylmalonyl-CoA/ethylmalonyl-CoA epimerase|nr:VOC family protein [Thermomicrobiales bacterium]